MTASHEVRLTGPQASNIASIARALPNPDSLTPGTKVVVLGTPNEAPSLTRRLLLSAFGRGRGDIPLVSRCTALVARGYVRVGAGIDANGQGRAFGHAPERPAPDDE